MTRRADSVVERLPGRFFTTEAQRSPGNAPVLLPVIPMAQNWGTPYSIRGCKESDVPGIPPVGKTADAVRSALPSYSLSPMGTRTLSTLCVLPVFSESAEARASASSFAG